MAIILPPPPREKTSEVQNQQWLETLWRAVKDLIEESVGDSSQDAFGRLRASIPATVFDAQFQRDKQPVLFSELTATGGTATYNTNTRSIDLAVTGTNSSSATFQSRRYFRYNAGKSHVVMITGNLGGSKTGCRRRIGYFDDANGLFFQLNGSALSVVVRSSVTGGVVDNVVDQSGWNLDTMDGQGVSRITIDTTKQQLFIIDFQWLGSGRVRFGFIVDGDIHYCHEYLLANIIGTPYSQTGTLPIRSEIVNTSATSGSTILSMTCCTVQSEGGYEPNGVLRSIDMGITTKAIASSVGVMTPVLAIRKSSTRLADPMKMISSTIFITTADDVLVQFILNPTLTGATFALSSGIAQADIAATATTGGTVLHSTYAASSGGGTPVTEQNIFKDLDTWLGSDLAGNSDIILVACNSLASPANIISSITFKEFT